MFLYLSKLLPLFIYPLGLACLLLMVALVMLWKKSRYAAVPVVAALVILLLTSNGWTAQAMVRSLEWQHIPANQLPQAEAIVVLGGGTKAGFPPRPGVDLSEEGDRVLYGGVLYKQGLAPLIIVSGGRIEWKGSGPPEAEDMTEILTQVGVPRSAIVLEPNSYNTHDNAVNVQKILQARGINRVLLVTSAMHMPRSLAIFKKQKIDAIAAPTDFLVSSNEVQEIQATAEARLLNLLPDSGHLQNFTRALKEYIGLLIYRLRGWA